MNRRNATRKSSPALTAALSVAVLAVAFQVFAYRNEPEGHRGMNWGEALSGRKDMVLVSMGAVSQFERPGDQLYMEESNVVLTRVLYHAVNGKLVEITEDILYSDMDAARNQLERLHGAASCIDYMGCKTICAWPGRMTSIQLEFTKDEAVLRYRSKDHEREWANASPPVLGLPSGQGVRDDGTGF